MDIHRLYDKYVYIGAYVNAGPKVDLAFQTILISAVPLYLMFIYRCGMC